MEENKKVYKVQELKQIISEEVAKQVKIKKLLEKKEIIKKNLTQLLEDYQTNVLYQEPEKEQGGKNETIFHTKPGNVISLSFQDVKGLKLRRQKKVTTGMADNDLLWRVEDPSTSQRLKRGDFLEIEGNDNLEKGNKFLFIIHRPTEDDPNALKPIGLKYETSPLMSWLNNA